MKNLLYRLFEQLFAIFMGDMVWSNISGVQNREC